MSSEEILSVFADFLDGVEAGLVAARSQIAKIQKVQDGTNVVEATFTSLLGWEARKGAKLGPYEITSGKANGKSDAWNHAWNILQVNNATIYKRFHREGYSYSFWIYQDRIYRQRLKTK